MERQYIVSERAHLMCPDMHFALCGGVRAPYDRARARQTLEALGQAHPFLRAVIAREAPSGRYFYDVREALPIDIAERADYARLLDDYRAANADGWDARMEGLLRVMVYPQEAGFHIMLIAHHLLCDGRGLLALLGEFAACYITGIAPPEAVERLPRALEDLPAGSGLPLISRLVVNSANRNWQKEKRRVLYADYRAFEKRYLRENLVSYDVRALSAEETARISALCRENGVSVNDYLVAEAMLREKTDKVIIAADIRSQLACYTPGALGNYSTAASVISRLKTEDTLRKARDVSARVKKIAGNNRQLLLVLACYFALTPELIDAAAISALGGFPSRAGAFVGGGMFGFGKGAGVCVTNLGRVESEALTDLLFIPPASPANRATAGVITCNGVMRVCTARRG